MAEAIARHALDHGEVAGVVGTVFVASAGVAAGEGSPMSDEAVEALEALGIQHHGTSKPVTADMLRKADRVLAMTESHRNSARRLLGHDEAAKARVELLDPQGDVEDPIGLGSNTYLVLAKRLRKLIPKRLSEVLIEHASRSK